MGFGAVPPLSDLSECIHDPSTPIGMRMRAAYYLRHLFDTSSEQKEEIISLLGTGLCFVDHGNLLRHEFAYVMGQLRDERVSKMRDKCFV